MKQNPEILKEYNSIIQNQLEQGIVEVVEKDGVSSVMVHYLPHHAVVRHDKDTTKVRVVYDPFAKSNGPSLNDCLHVGPKFNQKINELLFRFRSYPVALVADIEKAFLMISVDPNDRDVLRFLWVEDPFDNDVKFVLDMTTATFLRCVKRFAARHGLPRKFLSDNAKTFKSAVKVLRTVCDHPDVRSYLSLALPSP